MATWTQADIDVLRSAIKSGVKTVSYTDKTVTYHSLSEMLNLLARMELDATANSTSGVRSTYAVPHRD